MHLEKIKIFAIFLPQFHSIPENDLFWGKGFTEWDNVRKAKALYKNHCQPQVPIDGYYDLSLPSTLKYQSELAKKYGLSGFCFYHYYSVGKKLLEKPAENLLNNKDINIEFFFSWANHDWRRTWYAYNNEMLFEQKYGGKKELFDHYSYLRQFFLDNRYVKINNMPVFVIYRSDLAKNFDLMKSIWNECAIRDGFSGVYFVSTVTGFGVDKTANNYNAYYDFEPDAIIAEQINTVQKKYQSLRAKIVPSINKVLPFKMFKQIFDYKNLVGASINAQIDHLYKPYIQGAFARWDNTPRHLYNGRIIKNNSPELFKLLLRKKKCNDDPNALPYIIINSWNEWSEGSNIEPNSVDKYDYLEIIKEVLHD